MSTRSKVLRVPYFLQPTSTSCQSTVLKMFATYLESEVLYQSTGAADRAILDIWKDINTGNQRPAQVQNSHTNMKWWLEKHFPSLRFEYIQTDREDQALEAIVAHIDSGYPVLMSVSHSRVAGHIVLVVGYENYQPMVSSPDFSLVVHDPYGRFDPQLLSSMYGVTGKKRGMIGGSSLASGGEIGPGMGNRLPVTSVSRQRAGDARRGKYYLLSVARRGAAAGIPA